MPMNSNTTSPLYIEKVIFAVRNYWEPPGIIEKRIVKPSLIRGMVAALGPAEDNHLLSFSRRLLRSRCIYSRSAGFYSR